ncbi:MAG: hypothetical protein HY938_09830 [Nitrosomonadales bacterium]|nr:hypothetical protein [Nitrosomonadales bacterium]
MDNKAIFVRTSKGEDEAHSKTTHLAGDVKRALLMVDGAATFGEISKRVAPSLRANLDALFQELEKGGFVQDTTRVHIAPKISTPPKMSAPLKMATPQKAQAVDDDGGELDFMSGFSATPPQSQTADPHKAAANTEKMKVEAEAKAKQELEAAKLKAWQEAEAKAKLELEAAKLKAQQEAEAKARQALEAAKLKAQQEAEAKAKQELEAAKLKAQQEAEAKAKQELEAAKLKAQQEAEAKAKQELEAAKLKAQQEAEAKAKQELEAAKLKAQQEAAAILHQAEQEAARLREESVRRAKAEEVARLKAEQEASRLKAQQEAEAKAKRELEEAKLKAQQEAEAKARREREEAELKAQQEADAKARREREEAKIKAQQEAAAILHKAEQEAARLREESARRAKAEEEAARLKAEQEAQRLHEEMAAARLKAEHEEKLRLEAVAMERQQAEAARIKAEREAAEMQAELEAAKTRAELEAKARLEAETRALARMKAEEEKAAHIAAEHTAKEQEAAQAHADAATLASQQAAFQPAVGAAAAPAGKPGAFAFDAFQVDAPQTHTAPSEKSTGSAEAPGTVHAKKPDSFSFDSFQVDAPQPVVEAQKNQVPDHQAAPAQHPGDAAHITAGQPAPPPPTTNKPAVHKPDHAQPKRAEPEHIPAEERIAAEAQAKKLADEQAKVWAEAEQRALEAAKANAERVLHQPEHPAAEKTPVAPIARVSRKPFAWGKLVGLMLKLGIVLLVLLMAALFAVPYFMPMRDYMPKVEKMLSESINQPVHIGYLSGRILPTPRLDLGEVYIGEVKQFQAAQAQLNFSFSGLFDEKKPIDSVVMQNVKVSGKGLQNVSAWLQKLAANSQYPVGRMVISQGTLDADAFELTGIEGEINFNPASKFTQANLRANSGKYTLGINVTPEDKLQIAISVHGSALPLLPNWVFDDLNAKGELNNNELIISDYDARIAEGALQGNASINWRSGWRAQGTLTAKTIAMKQLNSLLDGNVAGLAHFKMTSSDLAGLANSAVLDGNFTASGGTINGMDIVETARLKSKDHLPGGRTHFKDFSGAIAFANNAYHFRQVKITTDVLNASAELDIEKRQLSGSINARLSLQESMGPVDLKIGGMIDSPWLRAARQ